MDRVIESRESEVSCVRDVGVAGSNPVTPTIDFRVHLSLLTVPKTVPVLDSENRAKIRLSLDALGRAAASRTSNSARSRCATVFIVASYCEYQWRHPRWKHGNCY